MKQKKMKRNNIEEAASAAAIQFVFVCAPALITTPFHFNKIGYLKRLLILQKVCALLTFLSSCHFVLYLVLSLTLEFDRFFVLFGTVSIYLSFHDMKCVCVAQRVDLPLIIMQHENCALLALYFITSRHKKKNEKEKSGVHTVQLMWKRKVAVSHRVLHTQHTQSALSS